MLRGTRFHSSPAEPAMRPTHPVKIAAAAPRTPALWVPDPVNHSWRERLRLRWSAALQQRLLRHLPGLVAMRADHADVLWLLGRHAESIAQYDEVLRRDAGHVHALLRAGVAHMRLHQPEAALGRFNQASKLAPDEVEPHLRRGTALCALRRRGEAIKALQRALAIAPHDARVHNQLGIALLEGGEPAAAMVSFDRALAIEPTMAKAMSNAAMVLLQEQRHVEAAATARKALAIDPQLAAAHANLGLAQMWLRQPEEALASFRRSQAITPDPVVAWNQAYLHLLYGQWREGWALLEERWRGVLAGKLPASDRPLWDGRCPLEGKTLLIHPEQGLGDVVQFCRHVPQLVALGAQVILHVPSELARLLGCLAGPQVKVLPLHQPVPAFDLRISIMSLPGALGVTPRYVPGASGYLSVDAALQQSWAQRMGPRRGPRVGLVWAGGLRPDQPEMAQVNARRNIPLRALAGLNRPGITWYSLQKGKEAIAEWHSLQRQGWHGPDMVDLMGEVKDFADTAAIISQLDLVIAVDTSTVHVAGALGKPVWVINRHDTCWRWLIDGACSPWYDSLRLFRQSAPDEPREQVVREVSLALDTWLAGMAAAAPQPTEEFAHL